MTDTSPDAAVKASEAVVAVVLDGNRMLVIRRGPAARRRTGYWGPPSGMIEPGESAAEAVERELKEEAGLDARAERKVWECFTDDGLIRLHWWLASVQSTELHPAPGEVDEFRWVTPQAFIRLSPRFSAHDQFVADILPGLLCRDFSERPYPDDCG